MAYSAHGEEAIPYWQRAAELFNATLAEKPEDPERQRNVALVEKYWGSVLDTLQRDDEASVHYSRARALDEKRYASNPNNRGIQFDLAIDLANTAAMAEGAGRLDEAYDLYSRSLEMRQKLSASDPRDVRTKGRVRYQAARQDRDQEESTSLGGRIREGSVSILGCGRRDERCDVAPRAATRSSPGEQRLPPAGTAASCSSVRHALKIFQALPGPIRDLTFDDESAARMQAHVTASRTARPRHAVEARCRNS